MNEILVSKQEASPLMNADPRSRTVRALRPVTFVKNGNRILPVFRPQPERIINPDERINPCIIRAIRVAGAESRHEPERPVAVASR